MRKCVCLDPSLQHWPKVSGRETNLLYTKEKCVNDNKYVFNTIYKLSYFKQMQVSVNDIVKVHIPSLNMALD